MTGGRLIILIILTVAIIGVGMSVYIVDQREYAIVFRLGKFVKTDAKPGLHFKVPLVNNVKKFDKRILTYDAAPESILTGEKKNVEVDYFTKWRIVDVEEFYRAFGTQDQAEIRMAAIIRNGLEQEFNKRSIEDVVSAERAQIMQELSDMANAELARFGVKVVDFRIKQIELPDNVRVSVFDRMRAERLEKANDHRAKGEKEREIIKARARREVQETLAKAQRDAETIKGEGDAIATETYANAYSQDPKFFEFYRSLLAYRESFQGKDDILVLEPDSEFFKYFNATTGN